MEFSEGQVEFLKKMSLGSYIHELIEHCQNVFPGLVSSLKMEDFCTYIEQGISFAGKAGYTQRGPVRLYIDIMLIFGSDFERDPLCQWLKIESEEDYITQIEKSMVLYSHLNKYIAAVCGNDGVFFRESLNKLQSFNMRRYSVNSKYDHDELHKILRGIYPQRYDFIGVDSVDDFINLARQYCDFFELKQCNQKIYLTLIMFLFGCSFGKDFIRDHLIKADLLDYLHNEDDRSHYSIVSRYSSFQIKNK